MIAMSANDFIELVEELKDKYEINIEESPGKSIAEENKILANAYKKAIKVKKFIESKEK